MTLLSPRGCSREILVLAFISRTVSGGLAVHERVQCSAVEFAGVCETVLGPDLRSLNNPVSVQSAIEIKALAVQEVAAGVC